MEQTLEKPKRQSKRNCDKPNTTKQTDDKTQKAIALQQDINNSTEETNNIHFLETQKDEECVTVSEFSLKPFTETQLAALYTNTELQISEQFSEQFIEAELRGLAIKHHQLYELLTNYQRIREKILHTNADYAQLKKQYNTLIKGLWTTDMATCEKSDLCQDKNLVKATHQYQKATFHRSVFKSLTNLSVLIRQNVYEKHVLYRYMAEDLRLQIELYLQNAIGNCMNAFSLYNNSPVILSLESAPEQLRSYLVEIRLCISILFAYQRRSIKEKQFLTEIRDWLARLVAVLLRVANYQDHLFILNHILRSPAGVGTWALTFLQTPLDEDCDNPFNNYQINHILTVLDCLLSPIKERDQFLSDIVLNEATEANQWIVVDSDGEEDDESGNSLKENDLVALFIQLPFKKLFKNLLFIKTIDFKHTIATGCYDEYQILKFLSFSTVLLQIVNKGLNTYNTPRYNQFLKRLSRFIRHVVQYVTDLLEIFQSKQHASGDPAMVKRLQVEYDAFLLRAIYYLYTSQKLCGWQFLAVLPYHLVSIETLWKIFYFLHSADSRANEILYSRIDIDYKNEIWSECLRLEYEEKLMSLAVDESYYLLNTFANMALARTVKDFDFIKVATMDLLEIGFLSETMQDLWSKSVRTLLTHLTSKYPKLLSDILGKVHENIANIGPLSLYLYEELPLSIWNINEIDLGLIFHLLNCPIDQNETKLARMIISHLNYEQLPYDLHCKIAILILQAVDTQMGYINFAWQTFFRLRLHLNDKAFNNLSQIHDPEYYEIIMKGLREQKPLASFLTIVMTSWGHLIPLICQKGLNQLMILQNQQNYEAVLFCLYHIVPLFVECQESLVNSEQFQQILINLINADRGYISMAKSLISTQITILHQFGNMIETQIVNYTRYGLDNPKHLVRLWVNSLISIANWNKDNNVIYLLDVIIKVAFSYPQALDTIYGIFKEIFQSSIIHDQSHGIGSLIKWVSSTPTNGGLIQTPFNSYIWLAYVIIDVEFDEREKRTKFWNELLTQLNGQRGKTNVDLAIKKSCSSLNIPHFTSVSLAIYRWAQQAIDTPMDHPILPLLWQKFFQLYLARIPVACALDKGCVGEKFFDGLMNFTFLKKVKKQLQATIDFYRDRFEKEKEDSKQFFEALLKLFTAFSLWLEEPRLQEANLFLHSLPPAYLSNLLAYIAQGSTTMWTDYVAYNQIKTDQENAINTWKSSIFRFKAHTNKPLLNPGNSMEDDDPTERIIRRISSYEEPKDPPQLVDITALIPSLDFTTNETLLNSLASSFKVFRHTAQNHAIKLSENIALDCSYQDLIPQLYRSILLKITKKVPCKGKNQTVNCSGAAVIKLEMQEAEINSRIEHEIKLNRDAYTNLLHESQKNSQSHLCISSVTLRQAIKILQIQDRSNTIGAELFYYILSLINEETTAFPPTKVLFSTCLEKLGHTHICGVEREMPQLLDRILKEPNLGGYLAPHFMPGNVGPSIYISMYAKICAEVGSKYDIAFALLSKFEIKQWLHQKQPKISQRTELIHTIVRALTSLGFEPKVDALKLQDLYRKQLMVLFEYQFPEHYGEILMFLIQASNGSVDTSLISISVWLDVINSLARPININIKLPLREQLRQYAQYQKMLNYQELLETAEMFTRHFTQERFQYGIFGLYPKCRNYVEVFSFFLGMISHGVIVSTINTYEGMLGDELCAKMWPVLKHLFTPWLVPYSMKNMQESMATWIQQLADDKTVLLPWIPSDECYAQKFLDVFCESIQFVMHTLPASKTFLNFIWQWYVGCFALPSVKDHILKLVHKSFLSFPWTEFWPTLTDLELMLRIVDQYLPECHDFLGHIFMSISWTNWSKLVQNTKTKIRVYQCLITLLIKLSNEPNVRAKFNNQLKTLLLEAESFEWELLDCMVFQHTMEWYVLSCDATVIFKSDPLDLDVRILSFLKTVSGFNMSGEDLNNDVLNKRLIFVKSNLKLVSIYANRFKNRLAQKKNETESLITQHLDQLDIIVKQQHEADTLLYEYLSFLNIDTISPIAHKCFTQWLTKKSSSNMFLKSMMKNLGNFNSDVEIISDLIELTITSYFYNTVTDHETTWREISEIFQIRTPKQSELEQFCLANGHLLTIYAILLHRIERCNDTETLLNMLLVWFGNLKPAECNESKIPLLWSTFLQLSLKHCEENESNSGIILYKFAKMLSQSSENNSSTWDKLRTAIWNGKNANVSINFRFLSRALAAYILAQLPEMKGEVRTIRSQPDAPCKVGQPGGNIECPKILMNLNFGQSQGKIKECENYVLTQVQKPENSMHNILEFLGELLKRFYTMPYLKKI